MQNNPGPSKSSRVAWDGTTARVIDVNNHVHFGFALETISAIAADAVFNVMYHDGTEADSCIPGPATPVPEIMLCDSESAPAAQTQIIIPAGTEAGNMCFAAPHCRNGRFYSLEAVSGDTDQVLATMTLVGTKF